MISRAIPALFLTAVIFGQSFEVASVRVTPRGRLANTTWGPYGTDRYTAENATLDFLVGIAFGVPRYQISGVERLGDDHYDISAKAEDGVILTPERLRECLQQLLTERFKLAVHRETKQVDGYALVTAKGGPKLQPPKDPSEMGAGGQSGQVTRAGIYPGGLHLPNMTFSAFAGNLTYPAGRPVVDHTGIEGSYDFDLTYARDDDPNSPRPSFFTALQEKFGLKLEKAKVPLQMLVIDRVDRLPTEN